MKKINALLSYIKSQYILDLDGIHGVGHWSRVHRNGLYLAERIGANVHIIELFSILHDSRRLSEDVDSHHGLRAAEFVQELREKYLSDIGNSDFDLLIFACKYHNSKMTSNDVTVQVCWDADRLDLWRVGIKPEPKYFSTQIAKDMARNNQNSSLIKEALY